MSDRLKQYFCMVSNFRTETNELKRKIILENGAPNLLARTGSQRLRMAIEKFIKENSGGNQGDKRAG